MRSRLAAALQQLPVLARPRRRRLRAVKRTTPRADGVRKPRPWRSPHVLTVTMRLVPAQLGEGRDSRAVPAHVWPLARRARLHDRRAGLRHRGAGEGDSHQHSADERGEWRAARAFCRQVNDRTSLLSDRVALKSDRGSLTSHLEDSESDRASL